MNEKINSPKVNGGGFGSRTYSFSGSSTLGPCIVFLSPVSIIAFVFLFRDLDLFSVFCTFVLE